MANQPATTNTTTNESAKPANLAESLPEDDTKQIEITGPNANTLLGNKKNNNNTKRRNLPNPNNANLTRKRNIPNATTGNTNTDSGVNTDSNTDADANEEAPEGEEPIDNKPDDNNNDMANTTNEDDEDPSQIGNAPENAPVKAISNNTASAGKNKEKLVALNNLAMNLFNHQIILKLFHFQTVHYGAHKASDAYLEKFAGTMDKFLEIAQGIYGKITLKKYTIKGTAHTDANIIKHIDAIITLMRTKINDILAEYTDLINVRDEMVGDLEQLKYLLTFK